MREGHLNSAPSEGLHLFLRLTSSRLSFPRRALHREIRPPTPRSEATVCAVTKGNIAELAASAFVALLVVLLSVRAIGYKGEQCSGGESVSQPPLRDKGFLTFLDQTPPFELRPKKFLLRQKAYCGNGIP